MTIPEFKEKLQTIHQVLFSKELNNQEVEQKCGAAHWNGSLLFLFLVFK